LRLGVGGRIELLKVNCAYVRPRSDPPEEDVWIPLAVAVDGVCKRLAPHGDLTLRALRGPLLDSSGNVVGIVFAKMNALAAAKETADIPQNVNFALKSSVAAAFLETNRVDSQTSVGAQPLARADLADRAKQFTVFIACTR
jgi:hypothetical protein